MDFKKYLYESLMNENVDVIKKKIGRDVKKKV